MSNIDTANKQITGFSSKSNQEILDAETTFGAHHYGRMDLVVRNAKGVWLNDIDGNKYLDCLAAYSAANQGHAHPAIVNALVDALKNSYASVISNVVYTDSLGIFLEKLATTVPQLGLRFGENGNKVLPKNGGVESVETAIKMARYYGFKSKGIKDVFTFHSLKSCDDFSLGI